MKLKVAIASLISLLLLGATVSLRAQDQDATEQEESSDEVETPPVPQPGPPVAPRRAPVATPPERRMLPSRAAAGGMISLNFSRADLVEVVHILAQHLRINYTIDPEVKGSVTIYSAEPIKQDDLFPIFHQILRINGAVAVRTGDLYRIAPIKDGKGIARPQAQGKEDSFALQVVPLRFFSVGEMKKLLTAFLTPGGEILDYPRGNFLILVDLPSNIQRLVEIKDLIDVNTFAGSRMELYQPKFASAEDLALEMAKVMQAYASSAAQAEGFAAQFVAIPRINQLLVISHSEGAWTYVQRWLERIDTLGEGPGRRIFIYPVENGKASDLADTLNQALGVSTSGRRESPRTLQDLHRGTSGSTTGFGSTRSQTPSLYGTTPSTSSTQSPMGSAFAVPAAPPASPAQVVPAPSPSQPAPSRPSQPSPARTEEQLRIVPDPATNSLIIYGTAQEFQNIKNILKELDIIPRQVLLDVLVAEVTLTDSQSLGVEYEILSKLNPTIFGQTFNSAGAIRGLPDIFPTGSQFGSGISGVIGSHDLRVLINALMTDSRVKVLSSPTILATDNRPARIQVGSEEPVPTGSVTSPEATVTTTTIQYRNTGRIVTIIPQVNSQGLVNLQILAEVSSLREKGVQVGTTTSTFPAFDTRQAETTAVVQDRETLVMGGIIADDKSRSRVGIPYLMDIPFFGRFFGTTTDRSQRTELLMLITPRVIRNITEARDVTEEFKQRLSTTTREVERTKGEGQIKKYAPPPPPPPQPAMPEKPLEPSAGQTSFSGPRTTETRSSDMPSVERLEKVKNSDVLASEAEVKTNAVQVKNTPTGISDDKKLALEGPWFVQVKALPSEGLAVNLAKRLNEQGYDAYVVRANVNGQTWYRVRVGHWPTRQKATTMLRTLQVSEGFVDAFAATK
jgi:general secretion pathway protein D